MEGREVSGRLIHCNIFALPRRPAIVFHRPAIAISAAAATTARMLRIILLLIALAAPASAQVKWDKPWQNFDRSPADGQLDVTYAFRNTGPNTVTIKSIKTSCGCTTARLEKKTIAPGEAGELTAKFKFGDRKGLHRKLINVKTDDGQQQELNFVVNIREALTTTPALIFWKVGQPAESRTVELTADPGTNVRVKSVTSSNPRVTATLQTVQAGERYLLTVKPADTAQKEAAQFTVQTDFPPDAPRAYTIHARIK